MTTSSSQETDDTESSSVIGCDTPEGTESAGELPESGCEPMAMEDDEAAESDAESETRLAEALREADEILSSGEESKEEPVEGSEADEMSSGEESKAEEPEGELPVEESVEESAPYEGEPEEYDFERAAHRDELFSQTLAVFGHRRRHPVLMPHLETALAQAVRANRITRGGSGQLLPTPTNSPDGARWTSTGPR